jgi:hypothetical protein
VEAVAGEFRAFELAVDAPALLCPTSPPADGTETILTLDCAERARRRQWTVVGMQPRRYALDNGRSEVCVSGISGAGASSSSGYFVVLRGRREWTKRVCARGKLLHGQGMSWSSAVDFDSAVRCWKMCVAIAMRCLLADGRKELCTLKFANAMSLLWKRWENANWNSGVVRWRFGGRGKEGKVGGVGSQV